MEGQEIIRYRGNMLPVARLSSLHSISTDTLSVDEGVLIVLEAKGDKIALLVDELVGQHQTVVKALPKYYQNSKGLSACSILGNGEVSLILDIPSLIELSNSQREINV
jgi:two-component system chemotaxis sensor kinase CheA